MDGNRTDPGAGYLISLSGDVLITPAMDFTASSAETLTFNARTYGGVNAANNVITIADSGSLKEMETQIIRHLLDRLSADEVCARLGISRVTLWRKMKKLPIDAAVPG